MEILSDKGSERAVLAGIAKYGADSYFDIADIINPSTFVDKINGMIYACF